MLRYHVFARGQWKLVIFMSSSWLVHDKLLLTCVLGTLETPQTISRAKLRFRRWNADVEQVFTQNSETNKFQTTFYHPWTPLFQFNFFPLACMAALIETASQFWFCAAQRALSGMFHPLSTDCHGLDLTNTFHIHLQHYMHPPKRMVHFWEFTPKGKGKKEKGCI